MFSLIFLYQSADSWMTFGPLLAYATSGFGLVFRDSFMFSVGGVCSVSCPVFSLCWDPVMVRF